MLGEMVTVCNDNIISINNLVIVFPLLIMYNHCFWFWLLSLFFWAFPAYKQLLSIMMKGAVDSFGYALGFVIRVILDFIF